MNYKELASKRWSNLEGSEAWVRRAYNVGKTMFSSQPKKERRITRQRRVREDSHEPKSLEQPLLGAYVG